MGRAARITPQPACPQALGHIAIPEFPALALSHVLTQPRCGAVHLWAEGCSQPSSPQPAPSDKDSCHKVGRWRPALLLTLTLGELLCLWQDISAGACCQSGAMSQERYSCSLFRELPARSVLESPSALGTFLFRASACHGRSRGRKKGLGAILGLAKVLQQRLSAGKFPQAGNKGNPPQQCGFNPSRQETGPQGANPP